MRHLNGFDVLAKLLSQPIVIFTTAYDQYALKAFAERIVSRFGDRLWFLPLDRVTHFYAEDKLTYAASDGKAFNVDHSIADLEKRLDPKQFVRIHRSTVVSLAWIKEVRSMPGGSLNIRLKDSGNTDLTVARDRAREFKTRIGC